MSTVTTTTTVTTTEAVTDLDPSVETIITEYNNAKAAIKELESQKESLDTILRALLKHNTVGAINGVERVRIVGRTRSNIDREALKTAFPEAYEATLTETRYTVLQAK